jgi:phosphoribosylformimino-5-aminoimidazole carboxamide ribotide isomerase
VAPVILFPAIDLKDGRCVRFEYLHLVDLDGAFAGEPVNGDAVKAILEAVAIPVQLGGGIRHLRTVEAWLEKGVERVIIGTAAVRDPELVREAARLYPGRIAVGIDARDGLVAIEGWAKTSQISAIDLGRRFEDAGVAALASGGLASIADIERLLEPDCVRLTGAITGRALYDGRLDAAEALALIKNRAHA